MGNKNWRLGPYEIQGEDNGPFYWGIVFNEESHGLSRFTGRTWIEFDTLIMGPWKVHEGAKGTWDEAQHRHESLPAWDKTTYCLKLADFGMGGLVNCKTLKEVPDKEATPIMLALGFTKVMKPKVIEEVESILQKAEGIETSPPDDSESIWPTFQSISLNDLKPFIIASSDDEKEQPPAGGQT